MSLGALRVLPPLVRNVIHHTLHDVPTHEALSPVTSVPSRAPRYLHRAVVSFLLVTITGIALRFLDLHIGVGLLIVVVQVAGYNAILTLMGVASPEKLSETLKFVLAALGGSLLWGAALLVFAYSVAR